MSTRVRSMWRRKSWPSPTPADAPSIRPGMSAITIVSYSSMVTTPRLGWSVVKG